VEEGKFSTLVIIMFIILLYINIIFFTSVFYFSIVLPCNLHMLYKTFCRAKQKFGVHLYMYTA